MFNTMTVALLERTTEIGIMRSIGASRMDILSMFIIESTLMGFCGGMAGIVLGVASGQIVNLIVNIAAKYMGGKVPQSLCLSALVFGIHSRVFDHHRICNRHRSGETGELA